MLIQCITSGKIHCITCITLNYCLSEILSSIVYRLCNREMRYTTKGCVSISYFHGEIWTHSFIHSCVIYSVRTVKLKKIKRYRTVLKFPCGFKFPRIAIFVSFYPKRKAEAPFLFWKRPQRKPFKTLGGGYPRLQARWKVCWERNCYIYWSSNFPVCYK